MKNSYTIKDGVCYIEVVRKSGEKLIVLMDEEDVQILDGKSIYLNTGNYVRVCHKCTKVYLHRLVTGASPNLYVDHINHNPLDNRKLNLRQVTSKQNMENRRGATKISSSGIRGVCFDPGRGKWAAKVKKKHLGRFDTPDEAEKAVIEFRRNNLPYSEMDKEVI